jgi:hypothetical protein
MIATRVATDFKESKPERVYVSHYALMNAPTLREWATHPKVSPSLRAHLMNAADYLEGQTAKPEQMSRKYIRLTIGPGESLMGGADFMHEIHDEQGNRVGHVWVTPMEGGSRLHVNHVGAVGHTPNALGFSAVRDLHRQLKAHYPSAQKISGTRVSGAVRANTGKDRSTEQKLSRKRYALTNRYDFVGALQKASSPNHKNFVKQAAQLARRVGARGTKEFPALHDTPTGSVPGVAMAVYGPIDPKATHALGSWVNGLLPNNPGYAVFHTRDGGPDTLYRMRTEGSGHHNPG